MLIRVHDESFVLFFYNSFILLDKKPLLLVTAFLTGGLSNAIHAKLTLYILIFWRRVDDDNVHVQQSSQTITRWTNLDVIWRQRITFRQCVMTLIRKAQINDNQITFPLFVWFDFLRIMNVMSHAHAVGHFSSPSSVLLSWTNCLLLFLIHVPLERVGTPDKTLLLQNKKFWLSDPDYQALW